MGTPISTAPKPFVFVLMPFAEEFDDVYQLGIKAAAVAAGAHCERVDEQIFDEAIMERVYNQIAKADVIVAEMTGRNPNVFYETGYAHALGKRVILVTQRAEDIPFDLKHFPHVVYGGRITQLRDEIGRRIRWSIENPATPLSAVEPMLEFYWKGEPLHGSTITGQYYAAPSRLHFEFTVHNAARRTLRAEAARFALVLPPELKQAHFRTEKSIQLPEGRQMAFLKVGDDILPDAWDQLSIGIMGKEPGWMTKIVGEHPLLLRVFSEVSTQDIPFTLVIKRP